MSAQKTLPPGPRKRHRLRSRGHDQPDERVLAVCRPHPARRPVRAAQAARAAPAADFGGRRRRAARAAGAGRDEIQAGRGLAKVQVDAQRREVRPERGVQLAGNPSRIRLSRQQLSELRRSGLRPRSLCLPRLGLPRLGLPRLAIPRLAIPGQVPQRARTGLGCPREGLFGQGRPVVRRPALGSDHRDLAAEATCPELFGGPEPGQPSPDDDDLHDDIG